MHIYMNTYITLILLYILFKLSEVSHIRHVLLCSIIMLFNNINKFVNNAHMNAFVKYM